jgi:enoyl-CoA hydratase/carnithine racemase
MPAHDPGTDKLLVDVADGVARLTFNNPAKRNALSVEMRAALPGVLRGFQDDPDVRVVVLTGAGDRAFVSGADISEFGEQRTRPRGPAHLRPDGVGLGLGLGGADQAGHRHDPRVLHRGRPAHRPPGRHPHRRGGQPLRGAGRPAGHRATPTAASRSWWPWWGRRTPPTSSSPPVRSTAAEAERIGLVNRVVPPGDLEDEVMALARSITANAPLTVTALKAALRESQRSPERRDLERVAALVEACNRSEDYREGQRAFLEKRPPRFTGR